MRQGPAIAQAAMRVLKKDSVWCEPFCGGLGAAFRVAQQWPGSFLLADGSEALITFWKAAFSGYKFPRYLTKRQYQQFKAKRDPKDPRTMWVGSGWSFSSRYMACYFVRKSPGMSDREIQVREANGINQSIARKVAAFAESGVKLVLSDYKKLAIPKKAVVYLDPPYEGSTKVHDFDGKFDYDEFWAWSKKLGEKNLVCASGFEVPKGWTVIHDWGNTLNEYSTKSNNHVGTSKEVSEMLFVPRSQKRDWE